MKTLQQTVRTQLMSLGINWVKKLYNNNNLTNWLNVHFNLNFNLTMCEFI